MEKTKKVEQRKLGSQGLVCSAQGLGAMGMTAFYDMDKSLTDDDKIAVFGKALEMGVNLIDTAWIYQNFSTGETNEELVGKALKKYGRDKFVVATKFGISVEGGKPVTSGKPELVRKQCADSLKRLDIECIDLYYMHRMDPDTPIEDTMKALLELKNEGKIKYVGLSECSASILERAHKVMPVSAVQLEWSLQTRCLEKDLVPAVRKLGVGIVAYSPLGRGFLSRTFTKKEDLSATDYRSNLPRLQGDNFEKNMKCMDEFEAYAKQKGISAGQLALAWVHSKGVDVFPIPGTKSAKRIEENALAANITLTKEDIEKVESIVEIFGDRYDEQSMKRTHNNL